MGRVLVLGFGVQGLRVGRSRNSAVMHAAIGQSRSESLLDEVSRAHRNLFNMQRPCFSVRHAH